jgi:hypothetical protein
MLPINKFILMEGRCVGGAFHTINFGSEVIFLVAHPFVD